MKKLTPNMAARDVRESVNYYVENFGFKLVMAVSEDKSAIGGELVEGKEYVWANVMCGDVGFMFQREDSFREDMGVSLDCLGASCSYFMEVEDVDALYEGVKERVEILKTIETTWYGAREFYVRDCNGYILGFATIPNRE